MNFLYRKIMSSVVVISLSIIVCSCGASHNIVEEVIYKDKDFTYDSLKSNDVVIAGIVSEKITLTDFERSEYSTLLYTVLLEELKDVHSINLINTNQMMQKVGRENYRTIMLEFDVEQELVDEAMQFIRESMPEADYIIFANIENENVVDRSSSRTVSYENKDDETTTHYKKTYYLTVEFQAYDLNMEKLISTIMMYNKAQRSESRKSESGCLESCLTSVFQTILFGSPAEIDREEVLAEIFKKYAGRLAVQ